MGLPELHRPPHLPAGHQQLRWGGGTQGGGFGHPLAPIHVAHKVEGLVLGLPELPRPPNLPAGHQQLRLGGGARGGGFGPPLAPIHRGQQEAT